MEEDLQLIEKFFQKRKIDLKNLFLGAAYYLDRPSTLDVGNNDGVGNQRNLLEVTLYGDFRLRVNKHFFRSEVRGSHIR